MFDEGRRPQSDFVRKARTKGNIRLNYYNIIYRPIFPRLAGVSLLRWSHCQLAIKMVASLFLISLPLIIIIIIIFIFKNSISIFLI